MLRIKTLLGLSLVVFALTLTSYANAASETLTKIDVRIGKGEDAVAGKTLNVHYTCWPFYKTSPIN